ncbi:hypothetical protein VFSR5_1020 [Aliivibrio fischeri SR5]|uniref:Uncharacterized protein n=1 Tax=Aliivibrio fischeri SR5 TaxID=1088719 RepID=A0AAV3EW17_ALIFS|nr:hypothetical protein VFSR5_1020 [Aliivibrio fischeri SR5]
MILSDFKHTDIFQILKVSKELIISITKFTIKLSLFAFRLLAWTAKSTYNYVMK